MGLRAPIYLSALTDAEAQALQEGFRAADAFVLRRGQILLASARGPHAREIATPLGCDGQTVRHAIQAFNACGLAALQRRSSAPHRTPHAIFDPDRREQLRTLLHQSPRTFGNPTSDQTRQVKQLGSGVRILPCRLPSKSPGLNPMEPKWVHGKRAVMDPTRVLPADELADRVCASDGCVHEAHLSVTEKVA